MKIIHTSDTFSTLNFEPGDHIMAGLYDFFADEDVYAGHISGLGAASSIEIAYYNLDTKEYERSTFTENLEILSLNGNVGVKEDGERVVHVHGTFGRRDFSVLGGHVFEIVVSGAGELHLHTFPGKIHRAYDKKTGLTLMCGAHT